jgi:hypothetical protein
LSTPGPALRARRRIPLRLWALLIVAVVVVVGLIYGAGHGGRRTISSATPASARHAAPGHPAAAPVTAAVPAALTAHTIGQLPAPVMDPAAASLSDGRVLLMGGLDSADVSVAGVEVAGPGRALAATPLPSALHDASAAPTAGGAYLFGGGEPSRDAILHVSRSGRATTAGRLPAPASDVSAAEIGGTFYVVGGYTGTTPLSTIVAWRPGGQARVVARLPAPVRYAAVASAGGKLVIAGGTNGTTAGQAVYEFDPAAGSSVRRIATLPTAVTHAAAAALGNVVYVLGGRGSALGTQTRRVTSIDLRTGRVRTAGRLPRGLSDAGVAAVAGAIVLAGGRDASGQVRSEVLRLEPR